MGKRDIGGPTEGTLRIAERLVTRIGSFMSVTDDDNWANMVGSDIAEFRRAADDDAYLKVLMMQLLSTPTEHGRRRMLRWNPDLKDRIIHPFARHVLRMHGLDALPMSIFSERLVETMECEGNDGFSITLTDDGRDDYWSVSVQLSDDVVWTHERDEHVMTVMASMPETIAVSMAGQPIQALVAHRSLEGMTVAIEGHVNRTAPFAETAFMLGKVR